MDTLKANTDLLEELAEALLERETLDRDEVELLAAGGTLPEAKLVSRAREFAETLRREISSGEPVTAGASTAVATESGRKSDVDIPMSAEREADATS